MVGVKHAKDIVGERGRVAVWEEGAVYILELGFCEKTRGTVFYESCTRNERG